MKTLDQLILKTLNPENPLFSHDLKDLKTSESIIKKLDITIKDSIFKKVFELSKEDEVSCFIKNYQRHLIYLSDCIAGYRAKFNEENPEYSPYIQLLDHVS